MGNELRVQNDDQWQRLVGTGTGPNSPNFVPGPESPEALNAAKGVTGFLHRRFPTFGHVDPNSLPWWMGPSGQSFITSPTYSSGATDLDNSLAGRQEIFNRANHAANLKALISAGKFGIVGLLAGAGHGMLREAPKAKATYKYMRDTAKDLPSEEERKRRSLRKQAKDGWDTTLKNEFNNTVTWAGEKAREIGGAFNRKRQDFFGSGLPNTSTDAGTGHLPPGWVIPAGGLAALGGYYGARRAVGAGSEAARVALIKKRKKQLQDEFEYMLGQKTAAPSPEMEKLCQFIDKVADRYHAASLTKRAVTEPSMAGVAQYTPAAQSAVYEQAGRDIAGSISGTPDSYPSVKGGKAMGMAILYALLAGGIGGRVGYSMRRKNDPDIAREKALSMSLNRHRLNRPLYLDPEAFSRSQATEEPEPVVPDMIGPAQPFEPDPELSMAKLNSWRGLNKAADATLVPRGVSPFQGMANVVKPYVPTLRGAGSAAADYLFPQQTQDFHNLAEASTVMNDATKQQAVGANMVTGGIDRVKAEGSKLLGGVRGGINSLTGGIVNAAPEGWKDTLWNARAWANKNWKPLAMGAGALGLGAYGLSKMRKSPVVGGTAMALGGLAGLGAYKAWPKAPVAPSNTAAPAAQPTATESAVSALAANEEAKRVSDDLQRTRDNMNAAIAK